jgi:hypothetical protein
MMISFVVLLTLIISEKSYKVKDSERFHAYLEWGCLYFNGTRGVWVALMAV